MSTLAPLDWFVLAAYAAGVVGLGLWLGRGQTGGRDYFLAGRRAPAWAAGLSVLATQAGAVSLIGAPAFVALHPAGGLVWLQYELAVPVAMMFLLVFLVPRLHRRGYVSVYGYLEDRFDRRTRVVVSVAFQVSRALATGVALYALAILLSATLAWPLAPTILAIGGLTLLYDAVGGMRAVLASDVLQMGVMVVGLGAALAFLVPAGGGLGALLAAADPARARTLDLAATGLGDGATFGFWPMLLGGFFLYVAYYGVDQSQAQRLLSTPDVKAARRALLLNGLLRFPFVLAYCLFGLLLSGYLVQHPEFAALVPGDRIDALVPLFILHGLPAGLTGLLVAGILAAAMSSVDSALNSLSAATLRDLVEPALGREVGLRGARLTTMAWGVACTAFAFGVGGLAPSILEAINLLGSLFYGPILAVFVLGMASRRATGRGARVGLAAGLALNVGLWQLAPGVSWLWWNPFGFLAAFLTGWAASHRAPRMLREGLTWRTASGGFAPPAPFGAAYLSLSVFFALVLAGSALLGRLLSP